VSVRWAAAGLIVGLAAWPAGAHFFGMMHQHNLPPVVARVAGDAVTSNEYIEALDAAARQVMQQQGGQPGMGPVLSYDQRRMILQGLIRLHILDELAVEEGFEADEEQVQASMNNIKRLFPSQEIFDKYLAQEGISEEDLAERSRRTLRVRAYGDSLTKGIALSEEELRARYATLKAEGKLDAPARWNFGHILIRANAYDEEAMARAKETADAAYARVNGGEDFAAVAQDVSDDMRSRDRGGLYEDIPKGQGYLEPEFEEKALAIEPGSMPPPFRTKAGWHIVEMRSHREAGTIPFEDVRADLKRDLLAEKKYAKLQALVDEQRDRFEVEVLYEDSPGANPLSPIPPAAGDAAPLAPSARTGQTGEAASP